MPLSNRYLEVIRYKTPTGETEILDADGYRTGEKTLTFSDEKEAKAFLSANSGKAKITDFGFVENYDKTLMIADKNCDIKEGDIVNYNGVEFIVKVIGRARCLSYLPIGMDKVDRYEPIIHQS